MPPSWQEAHDMPLLESEVDLNSLPPAVMVSGVDE
jgi:hypothetical protein